MTHVVIAAWGAAVRTGTDIEQINTHVSCCVLCCVLWQVCNALEHLPFCIKFMQGLRDRDIFRFCAIPQIMSIGTLAALYNNGKVFEGEGEGGGRQAVVCGGRCWVGAGWV